MEKLVIPSHMPVDLSSLTPTFILPPQGGGTKRIPSPLAGEGEGGGAERAKIKKAATEFESFFLYYMLKTMRQAVPKGGLLESRHSDTYLGLMDQEIANLAAKRGSLGLAQAIEKQMLPPPPPMRLSSSHAEHPIRELEKEGAAHEHIR